MGLMNDWKPNSTYGWLGINSGCAARFSVVQACAPCTVGAFMLISQSASGGLNALPWPWPSVSESCRPIVAQVYMYMSSTIVSCDCPVNDPDYKSHHFEVLRLFMVFK